MFSVRSSPESPEWVMAVPGTVGFIPVPLESKLSSFWSWSPAADEQPGPPLRGRPARIVPVPHVQAMPSATLLARVDAAVARARSRWTWDGERELAGLLGELGRDLAAAQGLGPQQLEVIMEALRAHRRELPRSWVYQAAGALAQVIGAAATPEHVRLLVQPMGWSCRDGRPRARADAEPAYAASDLVRILCRRLGGATMPEPLARALLSAALTPLHVLDDDWLVHGIGVLADYVAGLEEASEAGGQVELAIDFDPEAQNRHLGWMLDAVLCVRFGNKPEAAQRAQLLRALCDPEGPVGGLYQAVRWWLPQRLFPAILRQRARATSHDAQVHWLKVREILLRVHGPDVHQKGATSMLRPLVHSLAEMDSDLGSSLVWEAVGLSKDGKHDLMVETHRIKGTMPSQRDKPLQALLEAARNRGLRTLTLAIQGSLLDPLGTRDLRGLSTASVQERRQRVIHRMLGLLAAYPNDMGPEGPALIVREALRCHASLGGERGELVAELKAWWSENPQPFPVPHEDAVVRMLQPFPAGANAAEQLRGRLNQWKAWRDAHRSGVPGRPDMDVLLVLIGPELPPEKLLRVHRYLLKPIVKAAGDRAVDRGIRVVVDFHEAVWDLLGLSVWPDSLDGAAHRHRELENWLAFVRGTREDVKTQLAFEPNVCGALHDELRKLESRAEAMLARLEAAGARSDAKGTPKVETKGGDGKR